MSARKQLKALAASGRVVIKVGSGVLTDRDGRLDAGVLEYIAQDVAPICTEDSWPLIVSSGAIAVGMSVLSLSHRPDSMAGLQAAAAVGQSKLVEAWSTAFGRHGLHAAQILLTRADLADPQRYSNAANALNELQRRKVVSVVNENDTVAIEEIAFGDNDVLAAEVCKLIQAKLVVMLSVASGVLDGAAGRISEANVNDPSLDALAKPTQSKYGSGGMISKIQAARAAAGGGAFVAIIDGRVPGAIASLLRGEDIGTLLIPDQGDDTRLT